MPCFRSVAKGWRKQSLCRIACVYVSVYILFSCAWLLTALTCAFPPLFLKEGANRRWLPIRFFRQQQKRPSLVPLPPPPLPPYVCEYVRLPPACTVFFSNRFLVSLFLSFRFKVLLVFVRVVDVLVLLYPSFWYSFCTNRFVSRLAFIYLFCVSFYLSFVFVSRSPCVNRCCCCCYCTSQVVHEYLPISGPHYVLAQLLQWHNHGDGGNPNQPFDDKLRG